MATIPAVKNEFNYHRGSFRVSCLKQHLFKFFNNENLLRSFSIRNKFTNLGHSS